MQNIEQNLQCLGNSNKERITEECQRKAMKDPPDASEKNTVGIILRLNSSCLVLTGWSAGMGGRERVQSVNQHEVNVLIKLKFLNEYHRNSIQNAEGCGLLHFFIT